MKITAIVFVLVVVHQYVLADYADVVKLYNTYIAHVKGQCIESSGVDPQAADDALAYLIFNDDDESLRKYFGCLLLNLNIIDTEGNVNWEVWGGMVGVSDPEQIDKIYNICKYSTGIQFYDKAYNIVKCTVTRVAKLVSAK